MLNFYSNIENNEFCSKSAYFQVIFCLGSIYKIHNQHNQSKTVVSDIEGVRVNEKQTVFYYLRVDITVINPSRINILNQIESLQ